METKAEHDLLAGLGCRRIQGCYVAQPMDSVEFMRWMLDRRVNVGADAPPLSDVRRFGT